VSGVSRDEYEEGGTAMSYVVEVIDPPDNALARPMKFKLGPFATRPEAEKMAKRAQETNSRATTRIVECD